MANETDQIPSVGDLMALVVQVLDGLDPARAPHACCETALALDCLIDAGPSWSDVPVGAPDDAVPGLLRARELALHLLDAANSVEVALALGACARHLQLATHAMRATI